jgi:putative membrane protein
MRLDFEEWKGAGEPMATLRRPAAWLAAWLFLLVSGLAAAQQGVTQANEEATGAAQLDKGDRRFILKAIDGGMAEVEIGKLAQEKASSDKVKEIGRMLDADHSKAGEQLKQIAQQKGVTLPAERKTSEKQMRRYSKLSGEEFDREFLRRQFRHHEEDIRQFERVAEKSDDSDLKSFASATLPTLRKHRETIQATAQSLGIDLVQSSNLSRMEDTDRYPSDGSYPGRTDPRYPPGSTPGPAPGPGGPGTTPPTLPQP